MRNILLATDGSENAIKSAYYLADLYKGEPGVHVTVLTVSPSIPPLYREEAHDPVIRRQFESWRKRKEKEAREHIHEAVEALQKGGLKKGQVTGKYRQQVVGVARDIVQEMAAGGYDACVVGKKGMGWFSSTLYGSITGKLLEVSTEHPVWLVDGKKWNSKRVLVAMDETKSVMDLARYVGNMLKGVRGVEITFYHFCAPLTEDLPAEERKRLKELEKRVVERERACVLSYFEECKEVLLGMRFPEESLKYDFQYHTSARPKRVSQAIQEQIRKGGYGTLVIGRKGATQAKEFSVGSVTSRMVAEAKECAVWVV